MRRTCVPSVLLLAVLTACGGGTASPTPRPRVDSAVCDDLRTIVAKRAGGDKAGVSAAAGRVLGQLGDSSGAPQDVVAALRELAGGAPPDAALDATVSAWTARECG